MSILDNEKLVKASKYRIRYHPFGAAKEVFHRRDEEILVAGPKGTGKSLGVIQKLHLALTKYPEARGFMARKTRASMTNSCLVTYQDHVLKPPDKVHFHKQDQVFQYPNKSILAVLGMDNPDRLNSSEWDIGFMQEATEMNENDWEIATACLRNGKMPYQQLIGDCNPDRPTHWLKVRCDKGMTTMLKSYHEDNPRLFDHKLNDWTVEGIRYLGKLKRLSGVRHSRLYKGEWVAAEGVVYEQWDPQVNLISINTLPIEWVDWPHYWIFDFGFTHPLVWQDWVEAPNGDLIMVREIYRTGQLVEDVAHQILQINEGLDHPVAIICDHDAEDRATLERHLGMPCLPAYKLIRPGIQAVQKRLDPHRSSDGCYRPGIFICRDVLVEVDEGLKDKGKPTTTAEEFDGYVWDAKYNELVANSKRDEIPVDKDNHGMDAVRYLIAFIDNLADDPEEQDGVMLFEDEVHISPY